jgi:hypothetical protein
MFEALPYEDQVEVLATVPGKHGLAAVFFAVLTAKIRTAKSAMINPILRSSASGEARLRSLLATTIDETSVLPLPTEQQWRNATAHDFDLNAIACALRNSTPLRRADLRAKGYFHPFVEKQLVVENGIAYNYGRSKHLNTLTYNCE